jgi:arylsulfatase A-like enzyme
MILQQHQPEPRGASLPRGHDLPYVLSLLIPFAVYDLALKLLLILPARQDPATTQALGLMQIRLPAPEAPGFVDALGLLQSDLCFCLGYILLWVALFAVARKGVLRRIIVGLFHTLTIYIALIVTIAYQYFKVTGSTLDSDTLFHGLSSLDELKGLIASEAPTSILALLFVALAYSALGPPIIRSLIHRQRARFAPTFPDRSSDRRAALRPLLLGLVAAVLFVCSLLPGVGSAGVSKSFARDAFVNVIVTSVHAAPATELPARGADLGSARLPSAARLRPTATTRPRNVVLIFLESTRAGATTPYNKALPTTPFMDELAQRSLLVEQAYAIIPHTHSALTATNCGIDPPLYAVGSTVLGIPGVLPEICLPHLLRAQGYNTAFFKSTGKGFENSQQIIRNLGYEDSFALEDMNTKGFERTNYFGFEDEIMLEPSRAWLEKRRDTPFLAAYLTSAPHHDYRAPQQRHGRVAFTDNDVVNRYLNSVRNQDFFLKQLFDQYRQLGLYDNTVFILLGDHGQGFGEHGRNGHDNAIYDEGLRIPLLIHDPQRFQQGARLEGPVNQLDILPTVADLLGYTLEGEGYSGSSLLEPLPAGRTLTFMCAGAKACMASLTGTEKYINHFDDRPDEVFDLANDPAERSNLASARSPEELKQRRSDLLAWRAMVGAMYDARMRQLSAK